MHADFTTSLNEWACLLVCKFIENSVLSPKQNAPVKNYPHDSAEFPAEI
jgi:hypothetical protein